MKTYFYKAESSDETIVRGLVPGNNKEEALELATEWMSDEEGMVVDPSSLIPMTPSEFENLSKF
jgi:hypothetical protein